MSTETENQFKSQYGQDRYVLDHFFKDRPHGFFVEIGTVGGVDLSNTWYFEQVAGWDGLLIDANPRYCAEVAKVRRSPVVNCALADAENVMLFLDAGYVGGLLRFMGERQIAEIEHYVGPKRTPLAVHWVRTRRLDAVLAERGIERIDFLSVDVEGAEPQILSTLDFSKIAVQVITVEAKGEAIAAIRGILEPAGFEFRAQVGADAVFENPRHRR